MNKINNKITEDFMTISGEKIKVKDCWLPQHDLKYYPENPRIYSIVYQGDTEPTQTEIEERLKGRDHVKQLYQSIKANGGLIDPIIVIDKKNIVIEGNSRLAAYRILARNDPAKWGMVRCRVLPENIKEQLIFNLLGQYHIIGRKDWAPFEQAGYLWRRVNVHKSTIKAMAKEMGLSERKISSLLKVYSFMRKHKDLDVQRWSYYDELLKIDNKQTKLFPEFHDVIVKKIKTGEIEKARDIRDKVKKITGIPGKSGKKLVKKLLETNDSIENCFESALAHGADNAILKKFSKFREYVYNPDIKYLINKMEKSQKQKCLYEIKKIIGESKRLYESNS